VYRRGWRPDVLVLEAAAWAALNVLEQGGCVADALDAALAMDAAFFLGPALARWIEAGAFTGLREMC
jgi:hypothetical protein